jgi:hypothetical protein
MLAVLLEARQLGGDRVQTYFGQAALFGFPPQNRLTVVLDPADDPATGPAARLRRYLVEGRHVLAFSDSYTSGQTDVEAQRFETDAGLKTHLRAADHIAREWTRSSQ